MTVFKTTFEIVKKYKFIIILYTVILISFAGINLQNSNKTMNFEASKPDVLIINNDEDLGITKEFINYISDNTNIIDIENDDEKINDAIFYRDVNYIIYIPKNYRNDFLKGKNPNIEIKSSGDYMSSLTQMMVKRFINVSNIYQNSGMNENEIIKNTKTTLSSTTKVNINTKLDTVGLSKTTSYFNFLNYSILAGLVYILCLILCSFRDEKIRKRTVISSINYKKLNSELLLSMSIISIIIWLFYILLSFILLKDNMLSLHGMLYIINSFIFNICALTLAFLIGNLINNKDAVNGIINVVALGSSFLCGSFVPMEFLPSSVLNFAHVLPSYWFIKNNELIKQIEVINLNNISDIIINMLVIILFSLLFVILSNIVSKKNQIKN